MAHNWVAQCTSGVSDLGTLRRYRPLNMKVAFFNSGSQQWCRSVCLFILTGINNVFKKYCIVLLLFSIIWDRNLIVLSDLHHLCTVGYSLVALSSCTKYAERGRFQAWETAFFQNCSLNTIISYTQSLIIAVKDIRMECNLSITYHILYLTMHTLIWQALHPISLLYLSFHPQPWLLVTPFNFSLWPSFHAHIYTHQIH